MRGGASHLPCLVVTSTQAPLKKLFSDNYSVCGNVKCLSSFFSSSAFDAHTHSEVVSLTSLFQSIPFLSGFSTTPSSCPDLSSHPRRTLVSFWPPWGGSSITSRQAAGSRPGGSGFCSPSVATGP